MKRSQVKYSLNVCVLGCFEQLYSPRNGRGTI